MINHQALICVQQEALGRQDTGLVEILFTKDLSSGQISQPDPAAFPTRKVWISSRYQTIVDTFGASELFVIDNFGQTDNETESYVSARPENRAEHWAIGDKAKRLDPSTFLPVIDSPLPDIGSGVLSSNPAIPKGDFFILSDGHLFGPFSGSQTEIETRVSPSQCMPLNLLRGQIIKGPREAFADRNIYLDNPSDLTPGVCGFVTSMSDLKKIDGSLEKQDYSSDADIIQFYAKLKIGPSGKTALGRNAASQLKTEIENQVKKNSAHTNRERFERFKAIIDQYLETSDPGQEVINEWLKSEEGKSFLADLADRKPDLFSGHMGHLEEQKKVAQRELETLRQDKQKLEQQIQQEKNRVTLAQRDADAKIADIRKQTAAEQQEERRKKLTELEDEIRAAESKLKDLNTEISNKLADMENVRTIEDLKRERDYLERLKSDLDRAVQTHTATLKSPSLTEDLVKQNVVLGLLNGQVFKSQDEIETYVPPTLSTYTPETGEQLIQSVAYWFQESDGRSFSDEEMANILITLQQSFMTVFKGLPGAGKTSTAIRLAQAYGLADESGYGGNFINVPVSRGWVSGRDFIGFYNSLKGSYQPARTGMYQFLRHGGRDQASDSLRIALLDEANLSPIEHYMSDFLALFDAESRGRPIDTGIPDPEQRYLPVPKTTRFLATINNDSTTELLSPRLCDRVPVISMDQSGSEADIPVTQTLNGTLPYDVLESFFGISAAKQAEDYYGAPLKLNDVLAIFEERGKDLGNPTIVSMRKVQAMNSYIAVARQYMDESKAADFAIAQHVLPLINGFGKGYRTRLERVHEYAKGNNLPRVSQLVEEVMSIGDSNVQSYSFF